MRKVLFAALLIFTFALLMGGSCGPKEEAIPEEPTVTTPETPEEPAEEPAVSEPPEVEPLTNDDFQKVYFDFDKSNIRPDAATALQYNAEILKQYPDSRILIEGHCDERGTVEYNLALGERRAISCKDYLENLGISGSRIKTISYGKERPVALGHNEEAWQLNRRCEFKVQ
jgi:peptidoglycan-associated lipoprotein